MSAIENRPHLFNATGASNLSYLSWGKRHYGLFEIPAVRHKGWVYTLIQSGSPILVTPRKRTTIKKNQLVLQGPDFQTGWSDLGKRACQQITWVWRETPTIPNLSLSQNSFHKFSISEETAAQFFEIHLKCRREIAHSDSYSPSILKLCHEWMDLELGRNNTPLNSIPQTRFTYATAWLQQHWQEAGAVTKLAEYLQVSISTLGVIFKANAGITVAGFIHQKKMERALKLIEEGTLSKKQIAFELGYRHANDFSRAWHQWKRREQKTLSDHSKRPPFEGIFCTPGAFDRRD